jgi:hypothetical protein
MPRFIGILVSLFVLSCLPLTAQAASHKAEELRKADALTEFSPPETFLTGYFLADEMEPSFLFGTVADFARSLKCPTTWLIEDADRARLAAPAEAGAPLEYTLYLEADRPTGVTYYVFLDQSAMTPKQWIEWRKQFHKSKAEGEYGATRDRLEKAVAEGMRVGGELRFIMENGELAPGKSPEAALLTELSFAPSYDLKQGKKLSR